MNKANACLDATHLSTLWVACEEYIFWYKRDTQDLVLLHCLTLLGSLKNHQRALFDRLLEDEPELDPHPSSSSADICGKLWLAIGELATRVWRRRDFLGLDLSPDNLGLRLFPWAVRERHEGVITLLLEVYDRTNTDILSAVDFHLPDLGLKHITLSEQGPSLLREAVVRGDASLVGKFLTAGVICDKRHLLWISAMAGCSAVVDCLLQAGADVDKRNLLTDVIKGGHIAVAESLLRAGANVNSGYPLTAAIEGGYHVIVDMLLQAGADVNIDNPLWSAVQSGDCTTVDKLLRAGSSVQTVCLAEASKRGHESILDRLIQAGVHHGYGHSLNMAAEYGHESIVDMLLKADPSLVDSYALEQAMESGHYGIFDKLLQTRPSCDTLSPVLYKAVSDRHKAFIDRLLQAGATDHDGRSLDQAVYDGDEATVDKLLKYGTDINALYPLGSAVARGYKTIANKLLLAGANPNGPDMCSSALVMAMDMKDEDMVVRLLNAGARFSQDINSHNFTTIAAKAKSWDLARADKVLQEFSKAKSNEC